MSVNKQDYSKMVDKSSPPSPFVKNVILAFVIGGSICTLGQFLFNLFMLCKIEEETARALVSISLIFLSATLTAVGVYDNIAKVGGAGTLVPITGFANAVVSPAIEYKTEGFILGVGAKMFTIAGPVIVYGVAASVVYGLIYWITTLF